MNAKITIHYDPESVEETLGSLRAMTEALSMAARHADRATDNMQSKKNRDAIRRIERHLKKQLNDAYALVEYVQKINDHINQYPLQVPLHHCAECDTFKPPAAMNAKYIR